MKKGKESSEFAKSEGDGGGKMKPFAKKMNMSKGMGKTAFAKKGKHASMGAYAHK